MRISGNEPSSVILRQSNWFQIQIETFTKMYNLIYDMDHMLISGEILTKSALTR